MNDPAAFLVILGIASGDISTLNHEGSESLQTAIYDAESISLLKASISNSSKATADVTLVTVALRIIFEVISVLGTGE